jgi:hypothetical protein
MRQTEAVMTLLRRRGTRAGGGKVKALETGNTGCSWQYPVGDG